MAFLKAELGSDNQISGFKIDEAFTDNPLARSGRRWRQQGRKVPAKLILIMTLSSFFDDSSGFLHTPRRGWEPPALVEKQPQNQFFVAVFYFNLLKNSPGDRQWAGKVVLFSLIDGNNGLSGRRKDSPTKGSSPSLLFLFAYFLLSFSLKQQAPALIYKREKPTFN